MLRRACRLLCRDGFAVLQTAMKSSSWPWHAQIIEVVPVAPEWAFARTTSAGKQTIHAIKKTTDEANQVDSAADAFAACS